MITATRTALAAQSTDAGIRDLRTRREALDRTQEQIATGRRVVRPSDDPAAAAEAERTRASLSRIDSERRTLGAARTALGQADSALSDAGGLLQDAHETLVAAGNGSYGPTERAHLAAQLASTREQLLSVANRPGVDGGFLFGGLGATEAPFRDDAAAGGSVTYTAQAGQQRVGQALVLDVSQDGREAFTAQSAGGTRQNVFEVLDRAVALLRDPAATPATLAAGLGPARDGVSTGLDALGLRRTQVGEQLRAIDLREQTLGGTAVEAQSRLSNLVDLDLAEGLSQMSSQQSALDVAMKTYSQVSQMSLFKYL